jgi:isocitrate/isopropylmalate dehydrogenase
MVIVELQISPHNYIRQIIQYTATYARNKNYKSYTSMYPPTCFGDKTAIFRETLMQRYTQYQDINLLSTILN